MGKDASPRRPLRKQLAVSWHRVSPDANAFTSREPGGRCCLKSIPANSDWDIPRGVRLPPHFSFRIHPNSLRSILTFRSSLPERRMRKPFRKTDSSDRHCGRRDSTFGIKSVITPPDRISSFRGNPSGGSPLNFIGTFCLHVRSACLMTTNLHIKSNPSSGSSRDIRGS